MVKEDMGQGKFDKSPHFLVPFKCGSKKKKLRRICVVCADYRPTTNVRPQQGCAKCKVAFCTSCFTVYHYVLDLPRRSEIDTVIINNCALGENAFYLIMDL